MKIGKSIIVMIMSVIMLLTLACCGGTETPNTEGVLEKTEVASFSSSDSQNAQESNADQITGIYIKDDRNSSERRSLTADTSIDIVSVYYRQAREDGTRFPYEKVVCVQLEAGEKIEYLIECSLSPISEVMFADFDNDGIDEILFLDKGIANRYDPTIVYILKVFADRIDCILMTSENYIANPDSELESYAQKHGNAYLLIQDENDIMHDHRSDALHTVLSDAEVVTINNKIILRVFHLVPYDDTTQVPYTDIGWNGERFVVLEQGFLEYFG